MHRFLAFLLALCMVLAALCGCEKATPVQSSSEVLGTSSVPSSSESAPQWENEHLIYTLTQMQVDEFYLQFSNLEKLYLDNADLDEIEKAEDALEELSDYINDQCSIANVIYSCDTSDEQGKARYLHSREISSEIANAVMLTARRIYLSDAPNKDYFFEDWTDAELKKLMNYTEEVMRLEKRNAEILVAFRDLDEDGFASGMIPLYKEQVANNNAIAKIYGYDNYYTYATELEYDRDYSADKIQLMRQYAKAYLVPICTQTLMGFSSAYRSLPAAKQNTLYGLMMTDYNKLGSNYVDAYIGSLPQTTKDAMQTMFREQRVVFTDKETAQEGAYTTLIDDSGFCYFGPGYQTIMTVIHELGHFYGAQEGDMYTIPLDLAETQSQGNEWIFIRFLKDRLPEDVYDAFLDYKLYETFAGTLVQLSVDAFEQTVYSHPDVASLTEEDFNKLMEDACQDFGGVTFFNEYITDIQNYWRRVVLESPVYYVSYAVSTMAALNLYTIAISDFDRAVDIYSHLTEMEDYEKGFLGILEEAELPGPFDKQVYEQLYKMYKFQ